MEDEDDTVDYEAQRLARMEKLFEELTENHDRQELWVVARMIDICQDLENRLKFLANNAWAGELSGPYPDFDKRTAWASMSCARDISLAVYAYGLEPLTVHYDVTVPKLADEDEEMVMRNYLNAGRILDAKHVECVVSAVYERVREGPASRQEICFLCLDVVKHCEEVWERLIAVTSEMSQLTSKVSLFSKTGSADLGFQDRLVSASSYFWASNEKGVLFSKNLATAKVTVYSDGHTRIEYNRRDMESPEIAVRQMADVLAKSA